MKKFLLCTVTAAGLALASPAFAAPVVVENLGTDPNTGISFTPGAGTFDDAFTFSVDAPETLTIAAILNTYPLGVGSSAFISNFIGEIVMGTPATPGTIEVGPEMATSPCGLVANCQSLGGQVTLAAGDYFLEFTGDAGATASYGGTVNTVAAVPEPATWAMMILGFVGVTVMAAKRRRNDKQAFRFV